MKKEPKNMVFIGAGIISATLSVFMKQFFPNANIIVLEKLDKYSQENSNVLNNAGTGYSGFCELSSTKERDDGSVDISKAILSAKKFEISKEFWSYWVNKKYISNPDFIHSMPQMSFVIGEKNVNSLKRRKEALEKHPLFKGIMYSEDPEIINEWAPLMVEGRGYNEPIAATRMEIGTDVNYGVLTKDILNNLQYNMDIDMLLSCSATDIKKYEDGWIINYKNTRTGKTDSIKADFVFIGAGGGTLPLLQKAKLKQVNGLGGFPVSGRFLVCKNMEVINRHQAKVFGKVKKGEPPMSVPHLDTRSVDEKPVLLFGPYAGFSTKFLMKGSSMDLVSSITSKNLKSMISAGINNVALTQFLIKEVKKSFKTKMKKLREYYPNARNEDWEESVAGQRVQIINKKGELQFGTQIITSDDRTIAGMLGDSPGASTSVAIILEVLDICFPEEMQSNKWKDVFNEMIPSYNSDFDTDEEVSRSRSRTHEILNIRI